MRPIYTILIITFLVFISGSINGQSFQPETINRGLVAIAMSDNGVYIGWRLLATDPDSITFNVYRGETKINEQPLAGSTNFIDTTGTVSDSYTIVPVIGDVEQEASQEITPWSQNYITVPLDRPAGGTTPSGSYTYTPNDASVADLDGDGEYELVLKWDPTNSKDNSQDGYTGNTLLDGLEMDGTLLWRLDLGVNVRSGAHYSPFMVYDLDGDGKAEVVCRTAPGSKDGSGLFIHDGPADFTNHLADYRNSSGYILTGPEYLTVFNGSDGTEITTTNLEPDRGNVNDWGDSYGNRVDRFLAAVLYLGDENPSIIWARGIYTKVEIAAWDLVDGELEMRWIFKSQEGYPTWAGMGSHNLSIADVDGDNKDEIIYGNCAIDDDGTGLWTLRSAIGQATGDAGHLADIVPERPGLEKWACFEGSGPGSGLVDAATGEVIWLTAAGDVGRATAGDMVPGFIGMECWGGTDGLRSANNERVGPTPSSTNHVVWWDGDLGRELLDNTNIQKYGGGVLLLASDCSSNNGSKSNPCLQADIFGD
ncbi:MAG: rhamnogalacturonan lyase, partial [Calditrichaceae bacterium]